MELYQISLWVAYSATVCGLGHSHNRSHNVYTTVEQCAVWDTDHDQKWMTTSKGEQQSSQFGTQPNDHSNQNPEDMN